MTKYERLCEKVRKENDEWVENLKTKPIDVIMQHSWCYSIRQDIILAFFNDEESYFDLTDKQIEWLLNQDGVLYQMERYLMKYLDYMADLGDIISQNIDDAIECEEYNTAVAENRHN